MRATGFNRGPRRMRHGICPAPFGPTVLSYRQTFCRWRIKYGALKEDEAQRLKTLEQENLRLMKIVAEQALDIAMLKDLERGNGEPGAPAERGLLPPASPPRVRAPGLRPGRPAPLHPAVPEAPSRLRAPPRGQDERPGRAPPRYGYRRI